MQNDTTAIDWTILGTIYEQSLEKYVRKNGGIFYTPKFITQYVCENTIGELCTQKKNELNFNDLTTIDKIQTYKNWLYEIKIIDPACGSGAFLIAALDFLIAEHKQTDDLLYQLSGEALKLFDTDKMILEKNIYGVDINEESVEIAKLSLWLHTAKKERKLSNLSGNIKCGNSLVSEKKIAGEKAFDWNINFPEIMKNGGFDVIIGNPPYVRSRDLDNSQNNFILENYKFVHSGFDLATLFIEKGLNLLKHEGNLGFITTNKFFTARYGLKLRKYLIDTAKFSTIINLKSGIFADTPVETVIMIISQKPNMSINYTQLKPIEAQKKIESKEILNFETIKKAPNYIIYLPINDTQKLISTKIKQCPFKLKDFFSFNAGAGITGIESELENKQTHNKQLAVYSGSNIWRYYKTQPSYWAKENLIRSFNAKDVVLVRELSTKNRAVFFDTEIQIAGLNSITFVTPSITNDDKYKFILLFNSSLFGMLYELFYETTRTHSNLRYKEIYLSEIPIFDLNLLDTTQCKSLFSKMNQLTEEKNRLETNFINLLQSEFEVIKITNKLSSWHLLSSIEFIEELKKQKKELKLQQKNEWIVYFSEEQKIIAPIVEQIKYIDKEIDNMIYLFYNFTEQEIKIVENAK